MFKDSAPALTRRSCEPGDINARQLFDAFGDLQPPHVWLTHVPAWLETCPMLTLAALAVIAEMQGRSQLLFGHPELR